MVNPATFAGKIRLTVASGDNAAFWMNSRKEGRGIFGFGTQQLELCSSCLAGLRNRVWVEARAKSTQLRDIRIVAEYVDPDGVVMPGDTVTATGVWSRFTRVAHDNMTAEDLLRQPEWRDMNDYARANLIDRGGVGVLPRQVINGRQSHPNGIAIEFTLTPPGVGSLSVPGLPGDLRNDDRPVWDISRQIQYRLQSFNGDAQLQNESISFPVTEEQANDDDGFHDESARPTPRDRFYVVDAPGPGEAAAPNLAIYSQDSREFVRVRFRGSRPSGSIPNTVDPNQPPPARRGGVDGSRASPYILWWSRTRIVKTTVNNVVVWQRDPNSPLETATNWIATEVDPEE
jgi:hypothetical protein